MITGRLIGGGRLMGGRLIGVLLYFETTLKKLVKWKFQDVVYNVSEVWKFGSVEV